jgi:hypothetical protein
MPARFPGSGCGGCGLSLHTASGAWPGSPRKSAGGQVQRRRPGTGFRAAHRAAARLDPAGFNPSRCCAPRPPAMEARNPGQDATRRTEIRRLRPRPTRDMRQHPLQSRRPGCTRANSCCHAQRARDEAAPCARWTRRPAPVALGPAAQARQPVLASRRAGNQTRGKRHA